MKLEKIFMDKLSRRNNLSHVELMRAINNLPDRLGDAYHSIEMIDVIDHIARRYKLNSEERWELAGLVYDVILGLLSPIEIKHELKRRIEFNEEQLGFVQGELDAFIFNHIRADLNAFYGLEKESEANKDRPGSSSNQNKINDPYREPVE